MTRPTRWRWRYARRTHVIYNINFMCEVYKIPEGKIIIIHSDKKFSFGLLELNPKKELALHNRPVAEELMQIYGSSIIKIFGNKNERNIKLDKNKKIKIPAKQYHIHSNPTNKKSITLWKFNGDIMKIITEIRKNKLTH